MDDDVLHGHLQHHWAGATGGVALFERVAHNHGDPATAAEVGIMTCEIAEDRESLRGIMHAVGLRPSVVGTVTARVGAELGRLKPNGHIVTRSPLSDVLEVEALRDAVFAKRSGWELLRALADEDDRLDAVLLDELIGRADDQLRRLRALHLDVARKRIAA